mgnify:FL=1
MVLTELYKNKEKKLFRQPLTQMTAGPDKIPQYKINFKSDGPFHTIRIIGNYQEFRWSCDELDSWGQMPIIYEPYQKSM